MQLKIAIAFVVMIALWGAFMLHRHYKQEETVESHTEEIFTVMTKAALNSPMAGLTYMGMALENYRQDHQKYPERITELYPKYIKDQGFIQAVNWEYVSGKDNFRLQKTITVEGRQQTAYTDKSLRPKMKDDAVRVAAGTDQAPAAPAARARKEVQQPTPQVQAVSPAVSTEPEQRLSKEELDAEKRRILDEMITASKTRTQFSLDDHVRESERDDFFTVAGRATEVRPDLGSRYLVWKNRDGSLGFGNVLYPDLQQTLVYQNGQWITTADAGNDLFPETEPQWQAAPDGTVAERHGRTYLTWRDESGALGFGNVRYPSSRLDAVYLDGLWLEEEKTPSATLIDEDTGLPDAASLPLDMAERHGRQYLAWKDKSGALGFGNIHYPTTRSQSVWQGGTWLDIDPETVDTGKRPTTESFFRKNSRQNFLQQHGRSFLTWKDKNGILGFGNVIYPSHDDIDIIMPDGTWRTLTDNNTPGGGHTDE